MGSPADGTTLRGVEFLIDEDEYSSVDWAALRVVGPRGYEMSGVSLTGAADPAIVLVLDRKEVADEKVAGIERYRKIREVAGLEDHPDVQPSSIVRTWADLAGPDHHMGEAERLLIERRFETATIEAQLYFEMRVREEVEVIGSLHGSVALGLLRLQRSWSLMELNAVQAYTMLFGERPTQFDGWKCYRAHVERRNAIAHRGLIASEQDATASVAVIKDFNQHLNELVGGALENLQMPDPRGFSDYPFA